MDCNKSPHFESNCRPSPFLIWLIVSLLSLGLSACKDHSVQSYTIPKYLDTKTQTAASDASSSGVTSPMQALPGMEAYTQSASDITYTKPETWTEIAPTSVRKANFIINNQTGEAEVSVTVFPGDVGGLLANINRWRSQIGLDPIESASLGDHLKNTEIAQHPGYITKLEGNTQSILGGILPFHGSTWFIKMQGSILCIDAEEVNFKTFLASFKIKDHHH